MKNILICNQKGGTGKSTIADSLMWAFEEEGIPANFYDLDSQEGVIHKTQEVDDAVVSVIDTPGALQKELRTWVQEADLIIVPTKPSMMDMKPLMRMIDLLQGVDADVIFVENMMNRYTTAQMFDSWVREAVNGATVIQIPQSESIVQASAMGKPVWNHAPKSTAAKAMRELVDIVRDKIKV